MFKGVFTARITLRGNLGLWLKPWGVCSLWAAENSRSSSLENLLASHPGGAAKQWLSIAKRLLSENNWGQTYTFDIMPCFHKN